MLSATNRETLSLGRAALLEKLKETKLFDFLVIGGGIHGACFARQASQHGFKVLLCETRDYASGSSSRSSKMLHGGLRYLELLDFAQVFEGIKDRDLLFDQASHLCHPTEFIIPVEKQRWFYRLKIGVGLKLYDLLLKNKRHRHKYLNSKKLALKTGPAFAKNLMGGFLYTDGMTDDAALVHEHLLRARVESALCLNYVKVKSLEASSKTVRAQLQDVITDTSLSAEARFFIDCSGTSAGLLGEDTNKSEMRFSQGSHLVFDRPWNKPALFLEMEGKSRYYFVWPHSAGTVVGTTERELEEAPASPSPSESECREIMGRLRRDLPEEDFSWEQMSFAFAGIRALPLREEGSARKTGQLSRRHRWKRNQRGISLIGGKYTTAESTALEGLKIAAEEIGIGDSFISMKPLQLLGAFGGKGAAERALALQQSGLLSDLAIDRILERYGGLSSLLFEEEENLSEISEKLIRAEVQFAKEFLQAETVFDVFRRRSDLAFRPGNGGNELEETTQILSQGSSSSTSDFIKEEYRREIAEFQRLKEKLIQN